MRSETSRPLVWRVLKKNTRQTIPLLSVFNKTLNKQFFYFFLDNTLGKEFVGRVLEKKHSANTLALGKLTFSGFMQGLFVYVYTYRSLEKYYLRVRTHIQVCHVRSRSPPVLHATNHVRSRIYIQYQLDRIVYLPWKLKSPYLFFYVVLIRLDHIAMTLYHVTKFITWYQLHLIG